MLFHKLTIMYYMFLGRLNRFHIYLKKSCVRNFGVHSSSSVFYRMLLVGQSPDHSLLIFLWYIRRLII
jgi:hypothetical protein